MPTPYPPGVPSVSGNNITVDAFLQNPPRVARTVEALALNRFIADRVFAEGPRATGGAVLYDQVSAGEFFTERDVQAIEPGSEFPILNSGEHMPLVAAVVKWGGSAVITYEAARRDRRDLLNRELTRLRNTIVRKVDTVAIAALNAAPILTAAASADWGLTTTNPLVDIFGAVSAIDQQDLGYMADAAILNPAQALDLRLSEKLAARAARESRGAEAGNLLTARDLNGLAGIDSWYISNRVPAGTVFVVAARQVGALSDELPLYTRTVNEEPKERYRVMSARVTVPFVTDPKAAFKITGA